MWVVIALAGCTCGGKTTLANSLVDELKCDGEHGNPNRIIKVISADNYFFPKEHPGHIRIDGVGRNWELNSSIDVERVYRDMLAVTGGLPSGQPSPSWYSDINVLIVDGHTVLNSPDIAAMSDFQYFFTLPKEECLRRRQNRKYLNPDREGYFEKAVWPSHEHHLRELKEKRGAVKLLDGMKQPEWICGCVMNDLSREFDSLVGYDMLWL